MVPSVSHKDPAWRADPTSDSYEAVRHGILQAAEHVVNDRGIAGLRIAQVAEEVGCTRQNVHRYFPTKRDLVDAVLLERSKRLRDKVHRRLAGTKRDPVDRLITGLMISADIAARDRHIQSYYSGASAEQMLGFITDSAALRLAVAGVVDQAIDNLGSRLRTGVDTEAVTNWMFRIFVTELMSCLASPRSSAERRAELELLVRSPLPG